MFPFKLKYIYNCQKYIVASKHVKKLHKMVQRLANKAIKIDLIIKNLSNLHQMDEFKLYFATSQSQLQHTCIKKN